MKRSILIYSAIAAFIISTILGSVQSWADHFAYIADQDAGTVSAFHTYNTNILTGSWWIRLMASGFGTWTKRWSAPSLVSISPGVNTLFSAPPIFRHPIAFGRFIGPAPN